MASSEQGSAEKGLVDPSPDAVRELLRNLQDLPALSSSTFAHHPDIDRIIRQGGLIDRSETRGLALSMVVEDIIRNGVSASRPEQSVPWSILLMRYVYRMSIRQTAIELKMSGRTVARREMDGLVLFGRALIASLMPASAEER